MARYQQLFNSKHSVLFEALISENNRQLIEERIIEVVRKENSTEEINAILEDVKQFVKTRVEKSLTKDKRRH